MRISVLLWFVVGFTAASRGHAPATCPEPAPPPPVARPEPPPSIGELLVAHHPPPLPPPRRVIHVVAALPHWAECAREREPGRVTVSLPGAGVDLPSNMHIKTRRVCEALAATPGKPTPVRYFVAELDVTYHHRAPDCPPQSSTEIVCHGWQVYAVGTLLRLAPAGDRASADVLRSAIAVGGFPPGTISDQ